MVAEHSYLVARVRSTGAGRAADPSTTVRAGVGTGTTAGFPGRARDRGSPGDGRLDATGARRLRPPATRGPARSGRRRAAAVGYTGPVAGRVAGTIGLRAVVRARRPASRRGPARCRARRVADRCDATGSPVPAAGRAYVVQARAVPAARAGTHQCRTGGRPVPAAPARRARGAAATGPPARG